MRSRWSTARWLPVLLVAAACSRGPASIDISPKKVKIYGIDRSTRLTARVLDKSGQPMELSTPNWSSANAAIVEAEPGGRLVAKKAGKTTVTATFEGVSAQVPVEIVDVAAIEMSPPALSLVGPAGTSIPLSYAVKDSHSQPVELKPAWASADPKVATVSEEGVVTSVGPGKTTIITKIGDIQGGLEITVSLRPISRIEIRPATALVRVGDSQHFVITAYGPDGLPIEDIAVVFKSSDPAVATVDAAGVASGKKAGAATIRGELAGQKAEATLLVN